MTYAQLQTFSDFSVNTAFARIGPLCKKAVEFKLAGLALTDLNSVSGAVQFLSALEKEGKKAGHKVKPILGCTLNIKYNDNFGWLTVLCKNKKGWQSLLGLLAKMEYDPEHEQYLDWAKIDTVQEDLIAIVGGDKSICRIEDDSVESITTFFPYTYFFNNYGHDKDFDTNQVFYVNKEDVKYQQVITCSKFKTTLNQEDETIAADSFNAIFFKSNESYLKKEGDPNTLKIMDLVEEFSITNSPKIPRYKVNNVPIDDPDKLITEFCREGWKNKNLKRLDSDPKLKQVYVDRIKEELETFRLAGLSNYMLIIKSFMDHCHVNKVSCGLRGSAGGCLISYLINISDVDPVLPDPTLPYHPERSLSFSRFFNKGRISEGHTSLADIDLDVNMSFRQKLIKFIRDTYGLENTGHIITFNLFKGKGALKEAFRITDNVPRHFEVCNNITKFMIDEAKVQDELEDIRAEKPDYNIIDYNIENVREVKAAQEEFPEIFDIARKLANTISNTGIHAAGIVVASDKLSTFLPLSVDPKTGENIVAVAMADCEALGGVKYDILGLACFEKLDQIYNMVENNLLEPIISEDVDIAE